MEISPLISFFYAAQFKSISRASEVVCRSQPAVSQQIKALEEEVGCQLFNRIGKRKLVLTDAGKRLHELARKLLLEIDSALDDINSISGGNCGQIAITAPFTTCFQVLPALLKRFRDRFPNVTVSVYDRPQDRAIAMVRNGEADFAITLEPAVPKSFHAIVLKQVVPVLMVPSGHSLLNCKQITIPDIAGQKLILPPSRLRHPGRSLLESSAKKAGLTLNVALESSNVELSSRFVEMGIGISFATIVEGTPMLKGRDIQFIPIDHLLPCGKIVVAMRGKDTAIGAKANFLETLMEI